MKERILICSKCATEYQAGQYQYVVAETGLCDFHECPSYGPELDQLVDMADENGFSSEHLVWCQAHDWGESAVIKDNAIILIDLPDYYEDKTCCLKFTSFPALLDWAGY